MFWVALAKDSSAQQDYLRFYTEPSCIISIASSWRLIVSGWTCSKCGKTHEGTPGYSFKAPWPWYVTPEHLRIGCSLSEQYCNLFDEDFFIRGCIEIPILGRNDPLIWGVWVSQCRDDFEKLKSLENDPARAGHPPRVGRLCSRIPVYPDTLLLKARVHLRALGMSPYFELEPTNHPIAVEQRTGITEPRLQEIAEAMEHRTYHPNWDERGLYGGAK